MNDDWAIRQLFELPEGGDLFEQLADWQEDQIVHKVRLDNAIRNLLAEPIYENGEKSQGIAPRFLMRMTLLAHEAAFPDYAKGVPIVDEALSVLGDPAENSAESLRAAKQRKANG